MPSMSASWGKISAEERLFLRMMLVAVVAHVVLFALSSLIPKESLQNNYARVMQFRIGDVNTVRMPPASLPAAEETAEPDSPPAKAAHKPKEVARMATKTIPAPAKKAPKPAAYSFASEAITQEKRVRVQAPAASAAPKEALKDTVPVATDAPQEVRRAPAENPQAMLAEKPKERGILPTLEDLFGQVEDDTSTEAGPAIGELTQINSSATARSESPQAREARARYEQQISGWVARYRFYPPDAGGKQGRAVVRVRIDRQGNVRYYGIQETSGEVVFDRAAIDMIRRANPMPSVPNEYPAGNLIEFLIPITFKP